MNSSKDRVSIGSAPLASLVLQGIAITTIQSVALYRVVYALLHAEQATRLTTHNTLFMGPC